MKKASLFVRTGYFLSILIGLQSILLLGRAILFPHASGINTPQISSNDGGVLGLLRSINTEWIVFFIAAVVALMAIYSLPRDVGKPWGILMGGAAVASLLNWFLPMESGYGIFTYAVVLSCSFYAFLLFQRLLRN